MDATVTISGVTENFANTVAFWVVGRGPLAFLIRPFDMWLSFDAFYELCLAEEIPGWGYGNC